MKDLRAVSLCAAALIVLYLAISLRHLDTVPPVHEDEPWLASTGFKLAGEGVFGSDLMTGFFGMEHRYYGFMPVHPLLLASVFRVAGVGLFQARTETVMLGLGVLFLTGVIATRLFDNRVGVAAMAVLVAVPWLPIAPYRVTGIPLIDQARIARYDMGVAFFGLSAMLLFISASERRSPWRFAAAGFMIGASGLCNLYGFFWLPVLIIVAVGSQERPRDIAVMVIGLAASLLPYAVYVLSDLTTWAAQTAQYAPRVDLLDPGWYLANLLAEPRRYGITTVGRLLLPGPLLYLSAAPVSIVFLLRRAWREHDRAALSISVPATVLPLMLALLITIKQPGYLLVAVPLGAIAVAWGGVSLWRRARRPLRSVLVAGSLVVTAHGVLSIAALEQRARVTTPYPDLVLRLRAAIPAGARVLALHRFWFGLEDLEVRSWWVPFACADASMSRTVIGFGDSLEAIDPDVVLVDDRVRAGLASHPALDRAFRTHLERHSIVLTATTVDPTYGRIEIFSGSNLCTPSSDAETPQSRPSHPAEESP